MRSKHSGKRAHTEQRGSALLSTIIIIFILALVGAAFFQAGVIESQQTVNTVTDTRAYYAAESGVNRAAQDLTTDGGCETGGSKFDCDVLNLQAGTSSNPTTVQYPGFGSTCFGGSTCDGSIGRTPAYFVQEQQAFTPSGASYTDRFYLIGTSCVPGPAAGSCPSGAQMAQLKSLVVKTILTTTTTATTTINTGMVYAMFGSNQLVSNNGVTLDSYDSRSGCGSPPCAYNPVNTGQYHARLGSNAPIDLNNSTVKGSVTGTLSTANVKLHSSDTVDAGPTSDPSNPPVAVQSGGSISGANSTIVPRGQIISNQASPEVTLSALPHCSPVAANLDGAITQYTNSSFTTVTAKTWTYTGGVLTIPSGTYVRFSSATYPLTLCLNSIIVQGGDVAVAGTTVLQVNTKVDLQGGSNINTVPLAGQTAPEPQDFQIISTYGYNSSTETSQENFHLNAATAYLTAYAPKTWIKSSSAGTYYGAVYANKLITTGAWTIHYDKFLGSGNAQLSNLILQDTVTTTTTVTIPIATKYNLANWQRVK